MFELLAFGCTTFVQHYLTGGLPSAQPRAFGPVRQADALLIELGSNPKTMNGYPSGQGSPSAISSRFPAGSWT